MRRIKVYLGLALVLLGFGCLVPSIYPFYDDDTLVIAPEILGVWISADGSNDKETWEFRKNGEKGYSFIFTDESGQGGKFDAHVLQLGDYRFLDLFPDEETVEGKIIDLYLVHQVPVHTLFRLWFVDGMLHLAPFDLEWIEDGVRETKIRIAHVWSADRIVLTAETPELQRLITEHVQEAFSDPDVMRHRDGSPEIEE